MSSEKIRDLYTRVSFTVTQIAQQSWRQFKALNDGNKFVVAAVIGGVMTYGGLNISEHFRNDAIRDAASHDTDSFVQAGKGKGKGKTGTSTLALTSDKAHKPKLAAPKGKTAPITLPDIEKRRNLEKGQSLILHLQARGVDTALIYKVLHRAKKLLNPRRLAIGTPITLISDPQTKNLKKIVIRTDFDKEIVTTLDAESAITVKEVTIPITEEYHFVQGEIQDSLYSDATAKGLPDIAIHHLTNLYSYDIDFQRDIRPGSSFKVRYQMRIATKYNDQEVGKIDYAEFSLHNQNFRAYLYTDTAGHTDYFDEKGYSVRKALLKTPIDSARISSSFGMRKHPVLGYSKPHRGIDFAARRGTPIKASGKGVIERANWYGSYGRYIRIRHSNGYATAYAHLNRFARGIKKGRSVKQGDIIGYVGTTGRSTGPHLHYEVLKGGTRINPSQLKFPSERQLKGAELKKFNTFRIQLAQHLNGQKQKTALGQ